MISNNISFPLTRNAKRAQKNLSKSHINSLERVNQRVHSLDEHSLMSDSCRDEISSLPPPLTIEELMVESSLYSSFDSSHSKDRLSSKNSNRNIKNRVSAEKRTDTPIPLSEYTINSDVTSRGRLSTESRRDTTEMLSEYTITGGNSLISSRSNLQDGAKHNLSIPLSACGVNGSVSNSFHMLQPDASLHSIQLTSSPRKSASSSYFNKSSFSVASGCNRSRSPYSTQDVNSKHAATDVSNSSRMKSRISFSNGVPLVSAMPADDPANDTFSSQLLFDKNNSDNSAERIFENSPQRPISARSNATSVTLTASDNKDPEQLKQKLVLVRSENARLRTLVSQLRDQLEQCTEMANFASSTNQSEEQLTERILCLSDQIKANERTLKSTEDELDYKDRVSAEKDQIINAFKLKLIGIQKQLQECNIQKLNAESCRDEAAREAELLAYKLKESYSMMSSKLEESQGSARKEVARALGEQNNVLRKFEVLKQENEILLNKQRELQKRVRQLENESRHQDADAATMMDQAQQRIRELVAELDEKHNSLKKANLELNDATERRQALHREFEDLKEQNSLQRDRLQSSQQENELIKSEYEEAKKNLAKLKRSQAEASTRRNSQSSEQDENVKPLQISPRKHHAAVSELNMQIATKEAHIKRLEARLASQITDADKLENLAEELLTVGEKARASDRRANELEDVVHLMESERTKYLRKVNDLEDQMHDKTSECESLESRLKERTTLLNQSQRQVDDLSSKISSLESEAKQRREEVSYLKNTIKEESNDVQLLKSKLSDVQSKLMEKSRSLESAAERCGKQEASFRREIKKVKKLHGEQCEELMEQIETLQQDCNRHKSQSTVAKQQILAMNEEIAFSRNRVQQLEGEVQLVRNEESYRTQSHEEALKILEEKLTSSSNTVRSLEGTLEQYKQEMTTCIENLNEKHGDFQHQMALKTDQASKLETDLKLAKSSLHDECSRTMELEGALESRQKMLEDAASRIAELEESQANLQSQVAKQEQQIANESDRAKSLIREMEDKLQQACRELDSKKRQYAELNGALKKVDEDFRMCKKELAIVDEQMEELRSESETTRNEMERSRFEWKEMKMDLNEKIERVAELESENQKLSREEKKAKEKLLELETQVTELRSQHEDARQHNHELEKYSQKRNADILSSERTIGQLKETLRNSQAECENAKSTANELRKSLEERQWQLQQRAAQLTQLDMQVREFRSGVEKRNVDLENELERVQKQLKERNMQVAHLDEQMTSMRSDVAEVRRLLAEEQMNVKRSGRELQQKDDRIEELLKTVEAERKSREERHRACIETSQEVRLAREREQKLGRSNQDCQREIARLQREQQQLMNDLRGMGETAREKDDRLDRLTSQLSALTSEKISIEAKYRDELDRTQGDALKLKQQYEDENDNLVSINAQLQAQLRIATGNQTDELASALQREREAQEEARRAKESLMALDRELVARKQVIEAGNDTIIVKDAEIARLQAKLSGYERVSIMAALPNSPAKQLSSTNERQTHAPASSRDPDSQPPSSKASDDVPTKKPTWAMDDLSPNSLFTGVDSDVGSIAPSFMPIAASTKRRTDDAKKEDMSSYFLTSSPNQTQQLSGISAEEESLYKRVFGEQSNDEYSSGSLAQIVIGKKRTNEQLAPERCMADLQEKLRASERRRKDVASKLRNLKAAVH